MRPDSLVVGFAAAVMTGSAKGRKSRFCQPLEVRGVVAPKWRYSGSVPSIQVKDVPDDVHAVLRKRAAAAGQSLQEYLLAQLITEARTPTVDEVLDRAGKYRGAGRSEFSAADAVEAVRADRDSR